MNLIIHDCGRNKKGIRLDGMMHRRPTKMETGVDGRCHGVTLLEMLVVIAIVSILAALLWPVVDRTIDKSQGVQCTANMRTITMSILEYAVDNNGAFPPYSLKTPGVTDLGLEQRWPKLFFDALGDDVFYCKTLDSPRFGQAQFVDYGYNALFLGSTRGEGSNAITWVEEGRKTTFLSAVEKPSKTVVLAESLLTVGSTANQVGFYILAGHNNGAYRVDPRHGQGVIVSWADGHISQEVPDSDFNLPPEWFWAKKDPSLHQ